MNQEFPFSLPTDAFLSRLIRHSRYFAVLSISICTAADTLSLTPFNSSLFVAICGPRTLIPPLVICLLLTHIIGLLSAHPRSFAQLEHPESPKSERSKCDSPRDASSTVSDSFISR